MGEKDMYLKIAGMILIMGSSILGGMSFAEELSVRVHTLETLQKLILYLKGELGFHHASLPEAFLLEAPRLEPVFQRFLTDLAGKMELGGKSFQGLWESACEKLLEEQGFHKSDEKIFKILGEGLGYLDLSMQQKTLELAQTELEELLKSAREERRRKSRLYEILGAMAGAFLIILVI